MVNEINHTLFLKSIMFYFLIAVIAVFASNLFTVFYLKAGLKKTPIKKVSSNVLVDTSVSTDNELHVPGLSTRSVQSVGIQAEMPIRPSYEELRSILGTAVADKKIINMQSQIAAGTHVACYHCDAYRKVGHKDCFLYKPTASYSAWLGDALHALDVRYYVGKVDNLSYQELVSNKHQAVYMRTFFEDYCRPGASDHSLGTRFEQLYIEEQGFRAAYLQHNFVINVLYDDPTSELIIAVKDHDQRYGPL
ncbi:ORF2 protein [Armillaria borealis mycovirgavirus 1]|nr:ORF2 protein [Armillaria borealis mycovirgavirus 1]